MALHRSGIQEIASLEASGFYIVHWLAKCHGLCPLIEIPASHFVYVPSCCSYSTLAAGPLSRNGAHLVFNPTGAHDRGTLTAPGHFYTISISQTLLRSVEELNFPTQPLQLASPQAHLIIDQLIRISQDIQRAQPSNEVDALCLKLLSVLIAPEALRSIPEWLENAVRAVEENFSMQVPLKTLAQRTAGSRTRLERAFREHLGCSPNKFLTHVRVKHAALLLKASEESLADVAQATGFVSHSHFSYQFRRTLGILPAEYRELTANAAPRA